MAVLLAAVLCSCSTDTYTESSKSKNFLLKNVESVTPVSYTHLDVYKRQVLKEYYVVAVVNQFSDKVCLPDANSDLPALSFMRPALD